jgi:hypothetical protein
MNSGDQYTLTFSLLYCLGTQLSNHRLLRGEHGARLRTTGSARFEWNRAFIGNGFYNIAIWQTHCSFLGHFQTRVGK